MAEGNKGGVNSGYNTGGREGLKEEIRDPGRDVKEIRALMERSTTFLSLSGLSGVSAGAAAILGFIVFKLMQGYFEKAYGSYLNTPNGITMQLFNYSVLAVSVIILTAVFVIFFSLRKSRRKGLEIWNAASKRMALNLLIPLAAGGIFCLILIHHNLFYLISPSMLIFYGLALINCGKYTFNEIYVLGVIEIISGLLAAYCTDAGLWFWVTGFGVLNIIYGMLMYFRYEKG
jgi:hypothetical protein